MRKISILATLAVILPVSAFADSEPFSLQYITPSSWSGYDLHLTNPGEFSQNLDLTITDVTQDPESSVAGNVMNIKNFYKANAEVSVTKSYQEFDNTSQTNVSKTSASKSIKVRRETTTKLDRNISYSNYGFAGTVFIPFESPIPDSFIESAILTKKYVLNVDGVDYSLQKDTGSDYVAGSYYMSEKGITFFASNLSRFPSVARLKIDGAFSNYVVIGKTGYKLENPTEYQYKTNSNGTPVLTFTFFAPDKANYLQNYRFNVNGAYVDTGSVSVFGNRFSLDIPVATLSSSNVVIPVFIQDTQGVVSNTVYLRGEQYTGLKVTNVSLGDGKNTSFTMKISGDGGGFKVGYATDFFVSINGKDYSLLGTRVPVTSSNSATSTDSYGNTVYETKYVIRLTRGGDDSVSFDFYYSQFAEGKNTITIRNAITGKTSNTITFTKGDYSNIDYGTSSATTNGSGKQAYLWFQPASTILQKQTDFLYSPIGDITVGTISASNLDTSALYTVSFKLSSTLKTNPFKDIAYNGVSLVPETESGGTVSYRFSKTAVGNSFWNGSLTLSLNEYYNVDGNVVPLTLEGLTISNASGASVFAGGTAYPVSMGYKYDYGNCFDGGRDYCRLAGLKSPMATYSLLFGDKKVSDSSDEATKVEPVTIASISFQGKSNITKYEKYKQLYAQIKSRGYSEARIAKCGLAINKILRGMKILEDGPKNPLKFRLYLHGVARTMIKSGTSNLAELLKE